MSEKILEIEKKNADLQAQLDEIKGAMKRQGLGLLRTSKGPSDTMICHDMETEARIHQKEVELISENITLKIRLKTALALLNENDRNQLSETWAEEDARVAEYDAKKGKL